MDKRDTASPQAEQTQTPPSFGTAQAAFWAEQIGYALTANNPPAEQAEAIRALMDLQGQALSGLRNGFLGDLAVTLDEAFITGDGSIANVGTDAKGPVGVLREVAERHRMPDGAFPKRTLVHLVKSEHGPLALNVAGVDKQGRPTLTQLWKAAPDYAEPVSPVESKQGMAAFMRGVVGRLLQSLGNIRF